MKIKNREKENKFKSKSKKINDLYEKEKNNRIRKN